MKNPENPQINRSKPAIARAALLAEADNIDPEELADAKIEEMRKETLARVELDAKKDIEEAQDAAKKKVQAAEYKAKETQDKLKAVEDDAKEAKKESIAHLLKIGKLSITDIANVFGVTSDYVKQIEANMD